MNEDTQRCHLCREESPPPIVGLCVRCQRPICSKHNVMDNENGVECGPCAFAWHGKVNQELFLKKGR